MNHGARRGLARAANGLPRAAAVWLIAFGVTLLASCASNQEIRLFKTDGCSVIPDGSLAKRQCCLVHDFAYWKGGTSEERKEADQVLRQCILAAPASKMSATLTYWGVRIGGYPLWPTWFRWGYGWPYGTPYRALGPAEKASIADSIVHFREAAHELCGDAATDVCAAIERTPETATTSIETSESETHID